MLKEASDETNRMATMTRFEEAWSGWTESRLTQEEAARVLGVCERTFRRWIDRMDRCLKVTN